MKKEEYKELCQSLFGKTIAIIYIFEGEDAIGYEHYESWKTDVISSWMFAVEELHCLPLIMDLRTFVQKAMNKSLPFIDYVINLNNGTKILSTLGLVPSVCSFLNIPCIPCNTTTIICGEHKKISNIIAEKIGLNVPKILPPSNNSGITRPIGLGSSLGVKRGFNASLPNKEFIYQEFIKGFDITTPLLFNPITSELEVLPAILYMPNKNDVDWYLGEEEKRLHQGYAKQVLQLSTDAKKMYTSLAKEMGIFSYCRIDARLHCESEDELFEFLHNPIPLDKLYFLEINSMPTIKDNINFHTSMNALEERYSIYTCYETYKELISQATHTGFILSCSMISLLTTMH
ncbi:hypothetical protein [uncultured Clostridium sp.]|uniref:hypothetical protein n=1 Tax=uncultured Clostridium sp. TaxID=59620 RepID=UPI00272CED38|nr:hypothetical protein [uncultured Clostridium sp.]